EKPTNLASIVKKLDDIELVRFLNSITAFEYLPILISDQKLQAVIKLRLNSLSGSPNISILFLKKLMSHQLNEAEIDYAKETVETCLKTEVNRWISEGIQHKLALSSYVIDKNTFSQIDGPPEFKYYNELTLYAALYHSFILVLRGKQSFQKALRHFLDYIRGHDRHSYTVLGWAITNLWA